MKKLIVIMLVILSACEKEVEVEKIVYREDVSITNGLKAEITNLKVQLDGVNAQLTAANQANSGLSVELVAVSEAYQLAIEELQIELAEAIASISNANIDIVELESSIVDLQMKVGQLMVALDRYKADETFVSTTGNIFAKNLADVDIKQYEAISIADQVFIVTSKFNHIEGCCVDYSYMHMLTKVNGYRLNISLNYGDDLEIAVINIYAHDYADGKYDQVAQFEPLYGALYELSSELELDAIKGVKQVIATLNSLDGV